MSQPPASTAGQKQSSEPLAVVALALAILLLALPTQADLTWSLFRDRRITAGILIWVVCILVVLLPTLGSWHRQRREPSRWRSRRTLVVVTVLLSLNTFFFIMNLYFVLTK